MKLLQRLTCSFFLLFMALPWPAHAADYNGTIRIVVGFPPGGATDVVARIMGEKLRVIMNQPVIVDNKPGAGGMVATQQLKAAAPDGATVMLTIDHSHVIIPLTFKAPGYDPLKDFTALAGVASYYNVMALTSAIGVKTPAELGAWLKANPGKANYGIPAVGSVPAICRAAGGQVAGYAHGGRALQGRCALGSGPAGRASASRLFVTDRIHRTPPQWKNACHGRLGYNARQIGTRHPHLPGAGHQGCGQKSMAGIFWPQGIAPRVCGPLQPLGGHRIGRPRSR
jgi:tripartite-type tricarboxylate transporter receptor subunit TctC